MNRMKQRSIQGGLIRAVLLLELCSIVLFILVAVIHESRTRFRAFELALDSRSATLFGAVEDADDVSDNIMLEAHGLRVQARDYYDVWDLRGRDLGHSADWPQALNALVPRDAASGIYTVKLRHKTYRFVVLHAVRVIDPGEPGGGTPRAVTVRYGSPTSPVWREVREAVYFYAGVSLVLLAATAALMTWLLRRGFVPVRELAEEAARISVQQWEFRPRMAARSIVELAPLASALELTLERLRRSFEQQRRLTSDAAHELKTDLAIAKSSLQLLMMRPRSGEEYRKGLELCLADTQRLEETVTKMLLLARVEEMASRQSTGVALPCDAADCLDAGARQLATVAEVQGIALKTDAPAHVPVLMRTEDCVLVCTNLLLNAVQHSPSGSIVAARIVVEGGYATLAVVDEGDGISVAALEHVFEPFFRGDEARNRRRGGTGLGLAICKGLVEASGGAITVSSKPGRGTQVVVRLPLAPQQ